MKILIYISGVIGGLLLTLRLIGIMAGFSFNDILLVTGLLLTGLVYIPLLVFDRIRYRRKIEQIKRTPQQKTKKPVASSAEQSKVKGWSMNNSPYRDRKSGLTWGGGNVKGANATRGKRKSFLR